MSDQVPSRVYICHTFYHVYVAVMKELVLFRDGKADLILSTMSNDFTAIRDSLPASGVFHRIYEYEEQPDTSSEDVMRYHRDKGNLFLNLLQRIRYTKLLGALQESHLPVDLKQYRDVSVFCDSDPIGYYLNYKKIPYHAIEDGLNSGKLDDQARVANRGAWGLKKFMAKLGLIFIESGYSRYCIDYEVNDFKANHSLPDCAVEVPRDVLHQKLTEEDKEIIVRIFLPGIDTLRSQLASGSGAKEKPLAMVLTEPLCELPVRKKLFGDIIEEYRKDYRIIIKPHPRDLLDYEKEFPDTVVLRDRFPMEVLNDIPGFRIRKLISVITQIDHVEFADETVYLGLDFLDNYEDPRIHRKTELL